MNETKIILNRLLDKYEQSVHFSEPGRSKRRVLIKTDGNGLPEYDYQNVHIRDAFNAAIHDLTEKKAVIAQWLPGRKHLVAKEIWLNLERVREAYILAERQPLQYQIDEYLRQLQSLAGRINTDWITSFLTAQTDKLNSAKRLSGLYKKGCAHFADVLNALEHLDALDDSGMTMRAFSIACYRDSKYFERNIRDDFLAVAREYCPPLAELLADRALSVREQLAYFGIYARPEIYEFAGPLGMENEYGICDCSPLARFGCAVTSAAIFGTRKLHMGSVRRVMFIENKTNYDEYIEKARRNDELAVFHSGFLSPQKKKFILQIVSSSPPHAEYLFWADIDMGGFQMFAQLKSLAPKLAPWKMGPEEVAQYAALGLKRSSRYMRALEACLTLPETALFAETIQALLLYNVTIEQEVMLNDL
jgi:hypothetical protein